MTEEEIRPLLPVLVISTDFFSQELPEDEDERVQFKKGLNRLRKKILGSDSLFKEGAIVWNPKVNPDADPEGNEDFPYRSLNHFLRENMGDFCYEIQKFIDSINERVVDIKGSEKLWNLNEDEELADKAFDEAVSASFLVVSTSKEETLNEKYAENIPEGSSGEEGEEFQIESRKVFSPLSVPQFEDEFPNSWKQFEGGYEIPADLVHFLEIHENLLAFSKEVHLIDSYLVPEPEIKTPGVTIKDSTWFFKR